MPANLVIIRAVISDDITQVFSDPIVLDLLKLLNPGWKPFR